MSELLEKRAISEIPSILSRLLAVSQEDVTLHKPEEQSRPSPDLVASVPGYTFVAELKSSGAKAPLLSALMHLSEYTKTLGQDVIPLVVVPHMGKLGKRICEESKHIVRERR